MAKSVFGMALHITGEEDPIEISHAELLALRAFGLVLWNSRSRRFESYDSDLKKEALVFLKEFRAGGAS